MGAKHTVRFEPVGIELEVDEDETILSAAFRQGVMLMHGCKEGQCSACKSFLLDGEVDLDRYSTFALPEFEEAEGWTLLCRAHAYSDLEIELINYDEEMLTGGIPPRTVGTRVEAVEALTHDIRFLRLAIEDPEPFEFKPGQYVDIHIPGADGEHRSFSMANADPSEGVLDFMIKLYPGGRFSGLLDDGTIGPGDVLDVTGPVRGLHAPQLVAAAAVHRRRRRDGADPVAAALARRRRRAARGDVLLRRPQRGRPVPPGRAGRAAGPSSSPPCPRTPTAGPARPA